MPAYTIYQRMTDEVYKLKRSDFINSNNPERIFNHIEDDDGSTWLVERVYSASAYPALGYVQTSDGYAGAIYRNNQTGELIIVNAGTEKILSVDGINVAQMVLGNVPTQYSTARRIVQDALTLTKDIAAVSVTGHSLGGSLAQLQAIEFGTEAVTFNAYDIRRILDSEQHRSKIPPRDASLFETLNDNAFPELFAAFRAGRNSSRIVNINIHHFNTSVA